MLPYNPVTGNQYSGQNLGALASQAGERGYQSMAFAGFRQWQEKGRQVKKGEKACHALMVVERKDKDGMSKKVCKGIALFALEQTIEITQATQEGA